MTVARGEDELYVAFALDTRERVFEYSLRSSGAGGGIGTREYETEFCLSLSSSSLTQRSSAKEGIYFSWSPITIVEFLLFI